MTWSTAIKKIGWGGWVSAPLDPSRIPWGSSETEAETVDISKAEIYVRASSRTSSVASSSTSRLYV